MIRPLTLLGIDPGLRHTGWGVVTQNGNRLSFVAAGRVSPDPDLPMASRLHELAEELARVIVTYKPDAAAIEETFVNKNAASALKLGQARGAAMLAVAQAGIGVTEYAANRVKQSVSGFGHADKNQIQAMIGILLPGCGKLAADAADALAVAITHAHHMGVNKLQSAQSSRAKTQSRLRVDDEVGVPQSSRAKTQSRLRVAHEVGVPQSSRAKTGRA